MSLAVKTLSAVKSNYLGTIVRICAQFIAQIVIMRELGPDLVGTFGYTLLLYGVLALVIDQGFGWSMIQSDFSDAEIGIVLSRLMLASILGMIFVFFLSFPIANYLNNPMVGEVFRYSSPSYLLIAIYGVSHARLRADLRFREIQYATTGAYLIAYPIVGVSMAIAGFGVWSLLAAWYTQAVLQVGLGYYFSPHTLVLRNPFRFSKAGKLGLQVAGINVLNWGVDNSSGVFVGNIGPSALGNFNAASMLSRTPAMQLSQTLQTILFSTASAIGNDVVRIKRLYLGALASISFLIFPAYGYAITHADFLVKLVFGDKWAAAAGIFSAMAIGMVALSMSTLSGAILTATGAQSQVFKSQVFCLLLMITGLYFSKSGDLIYVGIAISFAYAVRFLIQLMAIAIKVNISLSDLFLVFRGPIAMSMLFAIPLFQMNMAYELFTVFLKLAIAIFLLRTFPKYFFCSALIDVVSRFTVGKKLLNKVRIGEFS
jgi:O-antigen/teichoic acid export membrane protein